MRITLEALLALEHPRIDRLGKTWLMQSAWENKASRGPGNALRAEVVDVSPYGEVAGLSSDAVEPLRIQVQEAHK